MCAETKEKKENAACCDPKEFQEMFERMGKCFSGKNTPDCSAMMKAMKMNMCSPSMTEDSSADDEKETKKPCCG
jgi:hypothetical protein